MWPGTGVPDSVRRSKGQNAILGDARVRDNAPAELHEVEGCVAKASGEPVVVANPWAASIN